MLSPELMRQFRRLQLKAKRAVQSLLEGRYHSAFRGTGLTFEEVRDYQPGDEIRSIDWNVTARMGSPFVKRFVEDRELTVMIVADLSGSAAFGSEMSTKRNVLAELVALVAFSAVSNQDRVGLIAGGTGVGRHLRPDRGPTHALRLLRDVFFFEPEDRRTDVKGLLDFLNRVYRRRAIVFLFSDFLDTGFEKALPLTGRAHDLIVVRVGDRREEELPDSGLVRLRDEETRRTLLVDTSDKRLRREFAARADHRRESLQKLTRAASADLVEVTTDGEHLDTLVRFFQARQRRLRRGG